MIDCSFFLKLISEAKNLRRDLSAARRDLAMLLGVRVDHEGRLPQEAREFIDSLWRYQASMAFSSGKEADLGQANRIARWLTKQSDAFVGFNVVSTPSDMDSLLSELRRLNDQQATVTKQGHKILLLSSFVYEICSALGIDRPDGYSIEELQSILDQVRAEAKENQK